MDDAMVVNLNGSVTMNSKNNSSIGEKSLNIGGDPKAHENGVLMHNDELFSSIADFQTLTFTYVPSLLLFVSTHVISPQNRS
jgi:hypothetical protein